VATAKAAETPVTIRCGAKLATINAADFQPFTPHGLVLA
jgi:hypothetical protein